MCTLVMRSAETVRNISELIESSMKAVKSGNELTSSAQETFKGNHALSIGKPHFAPGAKAAEKTPGKNIAPIRKALPAYCFS